MVSNKKITPKKKSIKKAVSKPKKQIKSSSKNLNLRKHGKNITRH